MAWGVKYQVNAHDIHDITWTLKLYEEDYAGAITYFTAMTEEPVVIDDCNESDDPIDPIRDKRAYVYVKCDSMFALADICSLEEMAFWAELYQGVNLYMAGWVDPGEYEESYGPVPYIAKIGIVDGLTILSKIKYEESAGVPYDGRRYESQVVLDVLGKIGFTAFKEFVNIYEDDMNDGVGDSPFDQLSINVDVFEDMYCDEVLKEILKKYTACIRQVDGIYSIYRPKELADTTIYGRHFTDYATKTAISITPEQQVWRPGVTSSLRQMPGSLVTYQRPAKKVTLTQDYGKRESWLDNYQFKGSTFDGTDFTGWTRSGAYEYAKPIGDYVGGEDEGVAIVDSELSPAFYLYQDIDVVASAKDILILEFEYAYYNTTAIQSDSTDITMQVKLGSHYLEEVDSTTMEWDNTPEVGLLKITEDVPVGWTGWKTWKRQVVGFPTDGTIRVSLYSTEWTSSVYACFKNIKLSVSSKEIARYGYGSAVKNVKHRTSPSTMVSLPRMTIVEIKEIAKKEHTATNTLNGDELNYEVLLGDVTDANIDNVLQQFAGALAVSVRDSLATVAAAFVTAHAADYSPGGVIVTSAGNVIRLTAAVAGTDFTGATSITNTSGDISGVVVNVQTNVPALSAIARIDEVVISGTSGDFYIICDGLQRTTFWAGTLDSTGAQFVTDHAAAYAAGGVTVTYNAAANKLIFTSSTPGVDFTGDTSFVNLEGDISGIVYNEATANREATDGQARIDEITLSGTSGTANITCDGVTEEVACMETLEPTNSWSTRGGSENLPLLQLVCNEIADLRDRPRQFVDMAISERTKAATALNLIGNIQDSINAYLGYRRLFAVNRCSFMVKSRMWKLDLVEIGLSATPGVTADSTTVTVDSTVITADSDV